MNLLEFLLGANMEALNLPAPILQKLQAQKLADFMKIHAALQAYRVFGKCTIQNLNQEELSILDHKYTDVLVENGLMKRKSASSAAKPNPSLSVTTKQPVIKGKGGMLLRSALNEAKEVRPNPELIETNLNRQSTASPTQPATPLSNWESRLGTQLRKAELIGEVQSQRKNLTISRFTSGDY